MMRPWMILLALTACGDGDKTPDAGPDAEPDESTPGPYLTDDATSAPTLKPKPVSLGIEHAIDAVMDLRTATLMEAYRSAVEEGDATCPTWSESGGTDYWFATCNSLSGASFSGVGAMLDYEDFTQGDYTYSGTQVYLVGSIETPEGHLIQGNGSVVDFMGFRGSDELVQYMAIEGEFSWDGPGGANTWLQTDVSPDLTMSASTSTAGWRSMTLNGAISGTDGAIAVVFHDVSVLSGAFISGDCIPEPNGAISMLDEDGNWIELEFEGNPDGEWPPPAAACDGCAQGWYKGLRVGEICPDVSALRDWEGPYPWL